MMFVKSEQMGKIGLAEGGQHIASMFTSKKSSQESLISLDNSSIKTKEKLFVSNPQSYNPSPKSIAMQSLLNESKTPTKKVRKMSEQKYDDIRQPTPGFEYKTSEITNIKTPRSTGKKKRNSKSKGKDKEILD